MTERPDPVHQEIWGNQNVQIQGATDAWIQVVFQGVTHAVPLERAHIPVAVKLPSPARLVRAHAGVVPYLDRGDLLADLVHWVDTPEPFASRVISGRAGAGKTRLGAELCRRLERRRWLCGFLARAAGETRLDALIEIPTPRLVVIDYASSRADQLERLLPLLNASAGPEAPVRVLLLVRGTRGHRSDLTASLANRIDSFDVMLDESDARDLEEFPFGVEQRHELFNNAVPALASYLRSPPVPADLPDLEEEVFANPLMVVIAAYLAAHGEAPPASREDLLEELLAHERRYWREGSAQLDVDDDLLERLVGLATLRSARTERAAADLLCLLPDLQDAPAERRRRLARWLHRQYPGPSWWNPLEPDLLGEYLVARCFAEHADFLRGMLIAADPEDVTRSLEVMTRAAADHPSLEVSLRPVIGDRLKPLCELAVDQAATVRDGDLLYGTAVTVAAAIRETISTVQVDVQVLSAVVSLMPPRHDLVLNDLAATLTTQEVERFLRPIAASDPTVMPFLAAALNNLSLRLADLGRSEEALTAIEEAVEIYRPLAATNSSRYVPRIASALNNLSVRLASLGRREEALAAIEEAVEIRRPLTESQPTVYGPDMAGALNTLANRLADLGRREEALAAIEEAVEIRRPLAEAEPTLYGPDLAGALSNLSLRLGENGQRKEALAVIEESVGIYRSLADANPAAYRSDFVRTLHNFSLRLAQVGRREEALEAIEEAVETYRPLASANPAAFGRELATARSALATRLVELGRREEALTMIEESVQTYRDLAIANPRPNLPDLAAALSNLSVCLAELGRHEEALEAIEESVKIRRPLVAADPGPFGPELAGCLNNLSNRLADANRPEEALEAIKESVETYRSLSGANKIAFDPDLGIALNTLANRLLELNLPEEALGPIEESVDIRRGLVASTPQAFQSDLAKSLNTLSICLASLNRHEEALAAIEEAASSSKSLVLASPGAFTPEYAGHLNNLSLRLAELGRLKEALKAIEEAIEIWRPLADANPQMFGGRLSISLSNYADRLSEAGMDKKAAKVRETASVLFTGEASSASSG